MAELIHCQEAEQWPSKSKTLILWPFTASLPTLDPGQQFSTGVPQEFLKHAVADYLVWGTDLLSLRLSNKKMTMANTTIAIGYK